jgi:predicted CXXCH cytochrome family protein
MAALFPPASNVVVRLTLALGALGGAGALLFLLGWARSPYATDQYEPVEQPVLFDHRHHVRDDGIDCLFCHDAARTSAYAGVPAASLCMSCHNQVWNGSAILEPVRQSFFSNEPIRWERVNRLPDFVYFNHSAHVTRGVGCVTCHGRVDEMAKVYAAMPLTMQWCLDCHRDPAPHLRPEDCITDMEWKPASVAAGERLRRDGNVNPPTECSGCHR